MKVKIYLNDGEDHFYGFKNEFANSPELTMVHEFEITETEVAWIHGLKWHAVIRVLDWVFQELNVGEGKIAKEYRAKCLRSLSVGDVVVVGETAWSVGSYGWDTITTEELNKAIIWDDKIGGLPK
jgi:hypothetical protein